MTIAAPRLAALLATSLLATTPALASGPVAPPPPARTVVAPVVSYDWGGFYAGLDVGVARGEGYDDEP